MSTFSRKAVYKIPAVIGVITSVGLLSALLGDGVWDALSWLLLAMPMLLVSYFLLRP